MQLSLFQESVEPDFDALERCRKAQVVALDLETETRWPGHGPKVDYGLTYPADLTVIALAWMEGDGTATTALAAPFEPRILAFLKTLIAQESLFIAHNAVFDFRQLSKLTDGAVPEHIWDTQSMARLLHPAVNASYSLLAVASTLAIPFSEEQQAMKSKRSSLHTLALADTLRYTQDDARVALQIYLKQRDLPGDLALVDWECRAMREYCRMAARGIRLNVPFVERRLQELGAQRTTLAKRLQADGLAAPGSSQARAKYLHHTKGIPLPRWENDSPFFTRAGRHRLSANPGAAVELSDLSTRSEVIESYREEGSPFAESLKDLAAYMEIDWLLSTLGGLLDHAVLDGRLHSLLTIATESGRRASSNPHMQNWKMPAMAGVAIGDEGFSLVEIDYNNAENIMAALISGDSNLSAACTAEDFHSTMASQYFGEEWEAADAAERKRLRNMAKKITYGTAYGMGAERLGKSIGVSTAEAQRLMRAKDAAFASVTRTREAAKREARQTGILKLWTGRPVAVPSAFVAWNFLCQGGVGEALKRALVLVSETYRARHMRSRVALDMHDALILEIAHSEWNEALNLAREIMTNITPAELNNRTTPPIRWRAAPNLEENQKKWGRATVASDERFLSLKEKSDCHLNALRHMIYSVGSRP
ncbi:MAG TPA: DNA polymerase [Aggregatilineales bacterium]|nr:DNA polymerase [Aggregatilineales bacterium]